MVEKITDLTSPPVIGRFYLVPVVEAELSGRFDDWPTHGPQHEDAEHVNFPHEHYHVDGRFLTKAQFEFIDRWGYRNTAWTTIYATPVMVDYRHVNPSPVRPEWRRRKCQRDHGPYPHDLANWIPDLEEAYAECRLSPGLTCPHRGAYLGNLTPDVDGVVTCPLHGLRWNLKTGRLVREPKQLDLVEAIEASQQ